MIAQEGVVFAHDGPTLDSLLEHGDFVAIAEVIETLPCTQNYSTVGGSCGRGSLPTNHRKVVKLLGATFDAAFKLPCLKECDRGNLFHAVRCWALDHLRRPARSWRRSQPHGSGQEDVVEYTAAECRGILANAFLGNVLDPMAAFKRSKCGLDFSGHYLEGADGIGMQKTGALLLYFEQAQQLAGTRDDTRIVSFVHRRGPALDDFENMLESATMSAFGSDGSLPAIAVHNGTMEQPENATGIVNFANADFGVGCFIASCTQEEILQMACPEFNVGMLHVGTMADDEVVVVKNCRRFVSSTGYAFTYAVSGPWDATRRNTICDILTMDATFTRHFARDRQLRDIRKAFTAFQALSGACVSTGRWGCGAFFGLPAHKFAQQVIAARMAGVSLQFSTFGSPEGCDLLLEHLQLSGCCVAQLWKHVSRAVHGGTFLKQLKEALACDATRRSLGRLPRASDSPRTVAASKGKGKGPRPPPRGSAKTFARPPPAVQPLGFGSLTEAKECLRLTETRVRQRDGTILSEKRSGDGAGFESIALGREATKPQYLLDQEAGLSRLEPKFFDRSNGRWAPRVANDAAGAPSEVRSIVRLVSYNVWFSERRQHARAEALFAILEGEDADIVCLQEVTPQFLSWLREKGWARERYAFSDTVGNTLKGSSLVYGVLMLIRRSLFVRSLCLHVLPSSMNRTVLIASVVLSESIELRVATVHLESLDNSVVRVEQLKRIFALLAVDSVGHSGVDSKVGTESCCAAVLAGDMNFDEGSPLEEGIVQTHNFVDCWTLCRQDAVDVADLGITMPEDDSLGISTRIDRVFLSQPLVGKQQKLVPIGMRRLGKDATVTDVAPSLASTEAINNLLVSTLPDRPSDHFGLSCDFVPLHAYS